MKKTITKIILGRAAMLLAVLFTAMTAWKNF